MGFRTVIIKERSKLDLKLNYLVCRNTEEFKVFIPEISVLILESTAISLTSALISELIKNNIKIIFCDEKHNPESEVCSYYGCFNNSKKIMQQIEWTESTKAKVWREIIKNKIKQQRLFLTDIRHHTEAKMLEGYEQNVQDNDITNREGHSAKVYFNAIYGVEFGRRNEGFVNSALNYGYSILLSCFNREVTKNGYLTQLGIWHKNEFNNFNFSSDLMEPFRILVDRIVYDIEDGCGDFKLKILDIFNLQIKIDNKLQYFENAISIYCQSVFNALENQDESLIKFYE